MSAGKGDTPRPVNKAKYDSNYDSIKWKTKPMKQQADQASKRPADDKKAK